MVKHFLVQNLSAITRTSPIETETAIAAMHLPAPNFRTFQTHITTIHIMTLTNTGEMMCSKTPSIQIILLQIILSNVAIIRLAK